MQRAPRVSVTTLLIVANLLAFVFEFVRVGPDLLGGNPSLQRLVDAGALVPILVTHYGEWWRIVTGGFLHGGLFHLAVNMYSLYALGRMVEAIGGSTRMAAIYAVSLVASGLAVVFYGGPDDVTVGASGAIFGLFGALFAMGFKLGRPGMDLVKANLGILVINLAITFWVPGIAMWAHVGGLIVGFIVAYAIFFPPRVAQPTIVDASTGHELEAEYEPPGAGRNPYA